MNDASKLRQNDLVQTQATKLMLENFHPVINLYIEQISTTKNLHLHLFSSGFQLQFPRFTTRQPTQTPRRSHANLQIPRSAPPDSHLGGADVGASQLNPFLPMGKQRQKHRGKHGKPDVAAMKTYHPGDGDGLKHLFFK